MLLSQSPATLATQDQAAVGNGVAADQAASPPWFAGMGTALGRSVVAGSQQIGEALTAGAESAEKDVQQPSIQYPLSYPVSLAAQGVGKMLDPNFASDIGNVIDFTHQVRQQLNKFSENMTPDPATTGFVSNLAFGAGKGLTQLALPGVGEGTFLASQAVNSYDSARAAGVDENTAAQQAGADTAFNTLFLSMPLSFGANRAMRAVTGAGTQMALGEASRATNSAILRANGYDAMADQYKPFDTSNLLADGLLGSVFHFMHTPDGVPKINANDVLPSDIDTALAAKNVQQFRDSAPGVPVDLESNGKHADAMDTAQDQIIQKGYPLADIGDKAVGAQFIANPENQGDVAQAYQAVKNAETSLPPEVHQALIDEFRQSHIESHGIDLETGQPAKPAVTPTGEPAPTSLEIQLAPRPEAPAPPAEAAPDNQLPKDLQKAAPRYKTSEIGFDNDIDKSLYITREESKTKSKSHDRYMDFLRGQGLSDDEIRQGGKDVAAAIKEEGGNVEAGEKISLPKVFERAEGKGAPESEAPTPKPEKPRPLKNMGDADLIEQMASVIGQKREAAQAEFDARQAERRAQTEGPVFGENGERMTESEAIEKAQNQYPSVNDLGDVVDALGECAAGGV